VAASERRWLRIAAASAALVVAAIAIGALLRRNRSESDRAVVFPAGGAIGRLVLWKEAGIHAYPIAGRIDFGPAAGRARIPERRRLVVEPDSAATLQALADWRGGEFDVLNLVERGCTDDEMAALATLTGLRELILVDCKIEGPGLAHLGALRSLERLHLRRTQVDDESLAHLSALAALRMLDLHGTRVTDAGVDRLARLKSLETLDLTDTAVTAEGIAKLRDALLGARILAPYPIQPDEDFDTDRDADGRGPGDDIADGEYGPTPRRAIAPTPAPARIVQFPSDRSMGALETAPWGSRRYEPMGEARGAVEVAAGRALRLTVGEEGAADLSPLAALAPGDLQSLDLLGLPIDDGSLAPLAELTTLLELCILDAPIANAGLKHLAGLTELRSVAITGAEATEAGVGALGGLTNLRQLRLDFALTGRGMVALKRLDPDCILPIVDPRGIDDEAMAYFAQHRSIADLTFDYQHSLTPAGARHLGEMTWLQTLSLRMSPCVEDAFAAELGGMRSLVLLNLGGTNVTDAALPHLLGMKRLEWLELSSTGITDAAIGTLKQMKSLRFLGVEESGMTPAGIEALREALPNCTIVPAAPAPSATPAGGRPIG
jgi:hypothetical protein